jgi:hypothetical protein
VFSASTALRLQQHQPCHLHVAKRNWASDRLALDEHPLELLNHRVAQRELVHGVIKNLEVICAGVTRAHRVCTAAGTRSMFGLSTRHIRSHRKTESSACKFAKIYIGGQALTAKHTRRRRRRSTPGWLVSSRTRPPPSILAVKAFSTQQSVHPDAPLLLLPSRRTVVAIAVPVRQHTRMWCRSQRDMEPCWPRPSLLNIK